MNFSPTFIRDDARFESKLDKTNHQLILNLLGGPYLIRGLNQFQKNAIFHHFGSNTAKSSNQPSPSNLSTTTLMNASRKNFHDPKIEIYQFDIEPEKHSIRCAGLFFYAEIKLHSTFSNGTLWTPEDIDEQYFIELILKNYLRVLMVYSLFKSGSIMLHSSAVLDQSASNRPEAHIFFGHSGDGKTTICRLGLESGRDCLSDDLNALHLIEHKLYVERIPFSGVFADQSIAGCYPVKTMYYLEKNEINHILPVRGSIFFAKFLSNTPFINKDPYRLEELSLRIEKMIECTHSFKLSFKPDTDVWELIHHHATLPYEK